MLKLAKLSYGRSSYDVEPTSFLPLPQQFDFEHPEECARKIFAIMSNASGGHSLRDCKLAIIASRKTANLTCSGAHVFYAPDGLPTLTVDEALALHAQRVEYKLGNVVTDQYGEGWKRARWYADVTDKSAAPGDKRRGR
jgi:hypothetical protein